jgi:hypothetical protein
MTAHYPRLRIPTASVTATLLEIVAPPGRWEAWGDMRPKTAGQTQAEQASDPAQPPIKQEGSCWGRGQVMHRAHPPSPPWP